MRMLLLIAVGGALGSVARFLAIRSIGALVPWSFPLGTLLVNILGSTIMGMLVAAAGLIWSPSDELRAFLTVGILGGFTTFSSFSLDVGVLIQRGDLGQAALYLVASLGLSILGLFGGMALVKALG